MSQAVAVADPTALEFDRRLLTIELKLDAALKAHEEEKIAAAKAKEISQRWFQWGFGLAFPTIVVLGVALGSLFAKVQSMDENGTTFGKGKSAQMEQRVSSLERDGADKENRLKSAEGSIHILEGK